MSPHGEVNKRSRFARVVLVAAGARITAQKRFAANWQQPRLLTDVTTVQLDKDNRCLGFVQDVHSVRHR